MVPESVLVTNLSSAMAYTPEIDNTNIIIQYKGSKDSLLIQYRVLGIDLGHLDPILDEADVEQKDQVIRIESDYTQDELGRRRFISSNKLEYSGSFSRGINFGNTQDLVLSSDFNLQMQGDLGNGLKIRAAISDDNIPIQPEGNTQVLQEFDKVFIEIEKDSTSIVAGDYELGSSASYFMKYYKKLKGLSIKNTTTIDSSWSLHNRGSFAIARGKFKRLQLETKEGNQGPYKLEGDQGEVFLQVLSGTEKVYADGRLLVRGENHDYVMDYNRAELRFTPKMIITANARIIVEYEFTTQSYLRSLYAATSSVSKGDWKLDLNFYNEQDSKSLTSDITLDSIDLMIMANSGDGMARRSGIFFPIDNNYENLIKYTLAADTLAYDSEEAVTAQSRAARFSNVGRGNGSYIIDGQAGTNGRVYKYVGPGGGNFDPIVELIPPEKKQLITAGLAFHPNDKSALTLETGLSNMDKNRFSEIDDGDNNGLSVMLRFDNSRSWGQILPKSDTSLTNQPSEKWQLRTKGQIEVKGKEFQALNPYRSTEFARDWNFQSNTATDELLYEVNTNLTRGATQLKYGISGFDAKELYNGLRNQLGLTRLTKSWTINAYLDILNSESFQDSLAEKTKFIRPRFLLQKPISEHWSLGARYEGEENIRRFTATNSLNPLSFDFDIYSFYIKSNESKPFYLNASVTHRVDKKVVDALLPIVTRSQDYNLGGGWTLSDKSTLTWNMTLRDYVVEENYLEFDDSKQTLIGLLDHKLKLLQGGLLLNTYFESNSGQEPKIEFQFVKVQKGEGRFLWLDSNMDSIPQLFEFQTAPISDLADYEKISIFNNEFVSTNKTVLNQSFKFNPKKFLKNKKSFLARFNLSSRYRIDQRSLNEGSDQLFRPIIFDLTDTTLVSNNSSIDNNLFFNRGHATYDIQLAYRYLNNQLTQINGREKRGTNEYYLRCRYNLLQSLDILTEATQGQRLYEIFGNLNYNINFLRIQPQLNYRPNAKLRFVGKYKWEQGDNDEALGAENSQIHDLGIETTWRRSATSNFQASVNLVMIAYQGDPNTAVELEMLQGLKDGTNYVWNFNYTRRIGKNFDLIMSYNGRKSEEARMVNNAGVQLRAIF